MNTNSEIIKQQMEIMINDFFVDKLINKNHDHNDLELNTYLSDQISELESTLNISFQEEEIQRAFLELCEKLNLLDEISNIKEVSEKIAIDIIENKIVFDKNTCNNLSENILKAYEEGFNVNELYKPVVFNDKYEAIKKILNEDIFKYLKTSTKWQEKEAIGTINTFLEAAEYSKRDINKLFNKSGSNKEFIKNLVTEINKSSLISSPFTIDRAKISFEGKGGGLYDYFMYSEKSKRFALNFSTRSKGTNIDGESIFRHTLSALAILNEYSNHKEIGKRSLKKTDKIFEHLYDHFAHYSNPKSYKEGAASSIKEQIEKNNGITKFKYQDQCIKGVNKRLPIALADTMKKINPDSVDIVNANYSDNKEIHTISKENNKDIINTVSLDTEDIDKLFKSLDFDFQVFYFGEVSSSKYENTLSNEYSNEELRAGLNILAYSGKNLSGIGGVKLTAKATVNLLERINYRFNTSTLSNESCLDIKKLNSNIRNIGGLFINKFMLNNNPFKLINETYEKESNQILENMAFFEKNVLQQIIEGITIKNQTPEQAYALTLGEFNIKPKLKFESFLENLEEKWDILSDEKIDNGNSLMIKHLNSIVESRNLSLKNEKMLRDMQESMGNHLDKFLNKGFTEEEIIKDNDFTSEILINRFGLKKVKEHRAINQDVLDNYEILYPNSNILGKKSGD
jgi:hypothetical protein